MTHLRNHALTNALKTVPLGNLGTKRYQNFEERNGNTTLTQAFIDDFLRGKKSQHDSSRLPISPPPPLATPRFKKSQKRVKSRKRVKKSQNRVKSRKPVKKSQKRVKSQKSIAGS
jgi:hypothetical protein